MCDGILLDASILETMISRTPLWSDTDSDIKQEVLQTDSESEEEDQNEVAAGNENDVKKLDLLTKTVIGEY